MAEIDISNVINVSVAATPLGMKEQNLSTIALFTKQQALNKEGHLVYRSPDLVAQDFGTDSEAYKHAVAIFSQTPNILTNSGYFVVIPLKPEVTIEATSGYALTSTINAIAFKNVSNGSLNVIVDGDSEQVQELTNLDFTNSSSLSEIATVLETAISGVSVTVEDSKLRFTSNASGVSSSVEFTANDDGTNLLAPSYLDANTITYVTGTAGYIGQEKVVDAVIRTKATIFYHAVLVDHVLSDQDATALSDYIQTQDMMLGLPSSYPTSLNANSLFDRIRSKSNRKTRCFIYLGSEQEARLMAAAYFGRGLCVNFNGSNTTLTMHLKSLATIEPDPNMTEALLQDAKTIGADCYVSIDGVPSVFSTGGNDFFDNVYNDNWLKTALEVAGFNALRQSQVKLPQTEAGVSILRKAYISVLSQGVKNGSFAPGEWTLPADFGDPEMLKANVRNFGYYVYSLPVNQQLQSDREQRKAPFIQIAVKRAGAIHSSDVLVFINN